MSFIVPGDRSFVIIPKHSNLPLAPTHHQKQPGNTIQQQEPYKNNPAQQFQLRKKGTGEYHVFLPYDNLYWAIAGVSPEAGASLIQWHMQDSGDQVSTNQRFRFMYAGDGYYYLRPVHARGRVLEVPGATHGQDVIKQGDLAPVTARDHQLFRVVPASADYLANEAQSFHQYNDLLRKAVLGAVGGLIPKGGFISGVLGVLWPDGHDQDFWNQMTQYVEQRIKERLKEQRIADLNDNLTGARQNAQEYAGTRHSNKLGKLIGAISAATQKENTFLRAQDGIDVLSLLASWGTLVLSLRTEMVNQYDALHKNETDAEVRREGKEDELTQLKDAIKRYGEAVQRSRDGAMEWRLSKIKQEGSSGTRVKQLDRTRISIEWRQDSVTDHYDGWRMERNWDNEKRNNGDPNGRANITYAKQARIDQVRAQFGAELDAILGPAYLWPYLDYTKPGQPTDQQVAVNVGTFGGRPGGTAFGMEAGGLKKVVICWADGHPFVCGLKLTYADNVERTYGVMGSHQATLELAAGEYIVNARGYEWDLVEGLILETNHGRLCEGGRMGQKAFFEAGLDDAVNARLVGISGSYLNNFFNTLTFHWEYTLKK